MYFRSIFGDFVLKIHQKKSFSMPSNAVFPMPSAFGIGLISNAVGIADAVTSIVPIQF
jgi:hypothetical protein